MRANGELRRRTGAFSSLMDGNWCITPWLVVPTNHHLKQCGTILDVSHGAPRPDAFDSNAFKCFTCCGVNCWNPPAHRFYRLFIASLSRVVKTIQVDGIARFLIPRNRSGIRQSVPLQPKAVGSDHNTTSWRVWPCSTEIWSKKEASSGTWALGRGAGQPCVWALHGGNLAATTKGKLACSLHGMVRTKPSINTTLVLTTYCRDLLAVQVARMINPRNNQRLISYYSLTSIYMQILLTVNTALFFFIFQG